MSQSHLLYVLRAGCSLRAGLSSLTTHACSVLYIWTDHEYAAVPLLMETEHNWGNRGLDVTAVNNHLLTRDQEMKEQLCKLKCPCLFIAGHSKRLTEKFSKKPTTTTKDPWLHFSDGVCYIVPRKKQTMKLSTNDHNLSPINWFSTSKPQPHIIASSSPSSSSETILPQSRCTQTTTTGVVGESWGNRLLARLRQRPCVVKKFQHQATPSQRQRPQQVPLVSS